MLSNGFPNLIASAKLIIVFSPSPMPTFFITRKFNTDKGPYNCEVSPNGKYLVVTYKSAAKTGVWELNSGIELIRLKNTRRVTHGVVISPDSRYAFVSVEGVGGEPGSVDIIDIEKLALINHVEVGKQAGGIAFWKMSN